jgi:OFA family oxalate/formate antiporter-like MFS transporter
MAGQSRRGEFGAGWTIVLGCMAGVGTGIQPIPALSGFFMPELAREFGWTFGGMSLGMALCAVVATLMAPVFGGWADRYGTKPVAMISLLLFGFAFASFALVGPSIWSFYAVWVVIGLVGIGTTPLTFSRLVNLWFFRNRGLALGIMLIGTSLSTFVIPPLIVWAIAEGGWRTAYLAVAALPLLVGLPLGLLLLRAPRAEEVPKASSAAATGVTLGEAMRDRRFWVIWGAIFLVQFAFAGAQVHIPEIVRLRGFRPADAATIMQVVGIAILVGRLVTGFLLDRFWAPLVSLPMLLLPAIGVVYLTGHDPDFVMLAGAAFLLGLAAGAESDLIAYLASRYFGLAHYGRIYGVLYMAFALASAFSPLVYGRVRDVAGTYDPMLMTAAGLLVGGAVLLLTLGSYPEFTPVERGA